MISYEDVAADACVAVADSVDSSVDSVDSAVVVSLVISCLILT